MKSGCRSIRNGIWHSAKSACPIPTPGSGRALVNWRSVAGSAAPLWASSAKGIRFQALVRILSYSQATRCLY